MITAVIIDDEPLAHDVILYHLQQHADIKVVAQCSNATEALAWLAQHSVDVLFLDINMPALSGMDMLKVLANKPQVVIVSAHHEYALQGFELDVTDYLLKPVSAPRFATAIDKVKRRHAKHSVIANTRTLILKVDKEQRKFQLHTITLLEAYGNYVKVWQGNTMSLVSSTLKKLLEQLPMTQFTQIHKSYIVHNQHVVSVKNNAVTLDNGRTCKTGETFKKQLQNILT